MTSTQKYALLFALLFAFSLLSQGQNLVSLAPNPHPIFLGNNGLPMAGGFLYTYAAGTTTNLATYLDSAGTIANPDPIPLDSTGAASNGSVQTQIWLTNSSYKFCAYNSVMVQQWCADNITGYLNIFNLTATWTLPQTFTQPITITAIDNQIVLGAVGNTTTLDFPPPSGTAVLNFPNSSDTMVGRNTVDTLTNKTLTQPTIDGVQIINSPGSYIGVANGSPTGTAINDLVVLSSNNGTIAPAGSDSGVIGVCVSNCGSANGNGVIQTSGESFCNFDGPVVSGHYVQMSSTNAGTCHDAGLSCPKAGQVIGRAMGTLFGLGAAVINMGLNDCFQTNPPAVTSIVAGAGAGTGPTVSCLGTSCTDAGGIISVTTGTAPTASATVFTITAAGTYSQYNCTFSPTNSNASALSGALSVSGIAATAPPSTFKIQAGATNLVASTPYGWQYACTYSF
jgi:hypothetical protein